MQNIFESPLEDISAAIGIRKGRPSNLEGFSPVLYDVLLASKVLNDYYEPSFDSETMLACEEPGFASYYRAKRDARLLQVEKRNAHTFKRLKQKGYYAESLDSLARIADNKAERESNDSRSTSHWPASHMFLDVAMDNLGVYGGVNHKFTDAEWVYAIEYGVFLVRPEIFMDSEVTSFAPFLDECIPVIWLCLLLKHAMDELQLRKDALGNLTRFDDMATTIKDLERRLEAEQRNAASAAKKLADAESARRDDWQKNQRELLRVEHEKDGQLAKLEKLVNTLQDEVSLLTDTLQSDEPPEQDEPAYQHQVSVIKPQSQWEPLPEKGVLFLGGHSKLIGRVKALHPDWTYINTTGYAKKDAGQNTQLVFVWPRYLSHALMWHVYANLPDGVPTVFLTASNLSRLEQEMREGYQRLVERESQSKA